MSVRNSKCWLFAGPTLNGSGTLARQTGVRLVPPVKRGDVARLVSTKQPAVIAIVDGQFHQCLSVGHAEIRSALENGWQVWGLASMGAIRAREMSQMGVHGYGKVYEWFCRDEDFRDDEVALTHLPSPPYLALSEPLIHLRLWLRELVIEDVISKRLEQSVLRKLMSMWFGERTLTRVREILFESVSDQGDKIDESLCNFDRFRLKCHDLSEFLQEKPWR